VSSKQKNAAEDRPGRRRTDRGHDKGAGAAASGAGAEGEEGSVLRRFWDQVGPIAVAVIIALCIRAVIIESYYVPSGSMLPTMYIGDHVFVSKFTFGARVPLLGWKAPAVRDPERGEIIVFALGRRRDGSICPLDQCPDAATEGFVKRIVAIPGDTIEVRKGQVVLNGEPAVQADLGEEFVDDRGRNRMIEEDLAGCRHQILDYPDHPGINQGSFTVPEDRYFMMGDNRDNSNDSRIWGTVHRDDLRGPVLINYWSWNNRESWLAMLNPITWVKLLAGEMYWDRIGMSYDCESPPSEPEAG
jgi:signal peptidase I